MRHCPAKLNGLKHPNRSAELKRLMVCSAVSALCCLSWPQWGKPLTDSSNTALTTGHWVRCWHCLSLLRTKQPPKPSCFFGFWTLVLLKQVLLKLFERTSRQNVCMFMECVSVGSECLVYVHDMCMYCSWCVFMVSVLGFSVCVRSWYVIGNFSVNLFRCFFFFFFLLTFDTFHSGGRCAALSLVPKCYHPVSHTKKRAGEYNQKSWIKEGVLFLFTAIFWVSVFPWILCRPPDLILSLAPW